MRQEPKTKTEQNMVRLTNHRFPGLTFPLLEIEDFRLWLAYE